MRVLILLDDLFASRESPMVARLEVGLADEGVRVLHAVPSAGPGQGADAGSLFRAETGDAAPDAGSSFFSTRVEYAKPVVPWFRRLSARDLVRSLRTASRDEGAPVDVVHVFGGAAWSLGLEAASLLNAGLVVEVWRRGLTDRARPLHQLALARARGRADAAPVFLAPDPGIERALLQHGPGLLVRPAPWGVHAPAAARTVLARGRVPSIMVVGSGRDPRAFGSAVLGLADVARQHPDFLVFMDALACRRADVWKLARGAGLLGRLSLVHELESRRDLLLRGDVLLQPEALGEQRSVLLDAMAAGMVVVAGSDPSVSALADGRNARLVHSRTREAWSAAISSVLSDRTAAQALANSAWEFVRTERRASAHVRAVLSVYEWMRGAESIAIGSATRAR